VPVYSPRAYEVNLITTCVNDYSIQSRSILTELNYDEY